MSFDAGFIQQAKGLNLDFEKAIENPASAISSILILMPALIQQFSAIAKTQYLEKFPLPPQADGTYDYIIVGGGTAGCVLANRLSAEQNHFNVLVLEAGGPPLPLSIIPMAGMFGIGVNTTDWVYASTPEKVGFRSTLNNVAPIYQGKILGGSSLQSILYHVRGSSSIIDDWVTETGDDSWSSTNVKSYFKISENYKGNYENCKQIKSNADLHGCAGEFPVEKVPFTPPPFLFQAAKENNFAEMDLTEPKEKAYMKPDSPIHGSVRYNAYSAFVEPVLSRQNLKVQPFAEVTKILFNDDNTKAIGVEYIYDGHVNKPLRAFASKEVIISAGALNTPKLLQLSGIGPKDMLSNFQIPLVKDLPVGKNLQDIVAVPLIGTFSKKKSSFVPERDLGIDIMADDDIQTKGPLASNGFSGFGFYSSKQNPVKTPDILHASLFIGMSKALPPVLETFGNINPAVLSQIMDPILGKDGHMDLVALLGPKSRGSISIAGKDFNLKPIIDISHFSDPIDLDRMVDGIRQIIEFYGNSTTHRVKLGQKIVHFPTCSAFEHNSYDYFKCWVKELTISAWGYAGTCKMGKSGDATAVTDSRLKVQGIANLRVVDASVVPIAPNAHLIPTVLMIAEKASDMIIQDAGGEVRKLPTKCIKLPPPKQTIPQLFAILLEKLGEAFGLMK